jgi:CubicO group peptidase (beta-lactamase class C family)
LPIDDISTGAMSAATGFYATAADLCRYARAHYFGNEELLTDASKREMQQPYWEVAQADGSYGLGFAVQKIGKRHMVGHGGGFPGHSTITLIDPRDQLVVVVLNNTHGYGGLAGPLAGTIVKLLDFALAAHAEPLPHSRTSFIGRFMNLWSVVDVAAFGDKLVALSPDDDDPARNASELEVVDADTLRIGSSNGYGSPGETLRYERDANGVVERVWIGGARAVPQRVFEQEVGQVGTSIAARGQ